MTIKKLADRSERKQEIDLTGPEGNAFVLMGYAHSLADKLDLDADAIIADMESGNYEHLIAVFDKYFGDYVTLYR